MGIVEEHWCTYCKRKLDKRKDKYVDFELVNMKKAPSKRGIICEKCIKKDKDLKKFFNDIKKAGNPPFLPIIECISWRVCKTYEPVKGPIRCANIAMSLLKKGVIYCKRKHPGKASLIIEKSEMERIEGEALLKTLKKIAGEEPFTSMGVTPAVIQGIVSGLKIGAGDTAKKIYVPPTAVVEKSKED